MAFATRSDLLARSNARRLAQLAVPADVAMVPDDALRLGITGGDLSVLSAADRAGLTLALAAIDQALTDADNLLLSYGIPDGAQSTLLARLSSTVALYYLQGAERMTDDVRKAYESTLDVLKAARRGDVQLAPNDGSIVPVDDMAWIDSAPRRYGRAASDDWSDW